MIAIWAFWPTCGDALVSRMFGVIRQEMGVCGAGWLTDWVWLASWLDWPAQSPACRLVNHCARHDAYAS